MSTTPQWLLDLAPRSEMAGLVADFDWDDTPLGPPTSWPEPLVVALQLALSSRFPMLVVWGPELTMLYNDGYRDLLGVDKHPSGLGAPTAEVWAEVWDDIGPLFDGVMAGGEATWGEHLPLRIVRNGFEEETYFTFSYSPILDAEGRIGGVLDVAMETTSEVVAQRRLATLGRLAATLVSAKDVTDVCTLAVAALDGALDLPSAEIGLRLGDRLVPVATNGIHLVASAEGTGLIDVVDAGEIAVLDEAAVAGAPVDRVAVPVGSGWSAGVLVLGLNPARPFDDDYRSFVGVVGRAVGAALENAYLRSVELGEQRHISETLQEAMLQPASDLPTVAARYRPATGGLSVGGDWYDVISLPDGRRALVVGDCVGHGLDAATVMGQLRSVSRALLLEGLEPAEVLAGMDRFAASVPGAECTTMVCAVVDVEHHTMVFACAGHPAPLLVRDGVGSWLEGGRGTPLAVGSLDRRQATVELAPDDLLLLFTDGLVERRGEPIDDGLRRLRRSAEAHGGAAVQAIADALLREVLEVRPRDDVALLVKRVH